MAQWHPAAVRIPGNNAGTYTGGQPKGVLHTTEGASAEGAFGAYRANNSWPHFTIDLKRRKLWQHLPINVAARSLKHPAGVGETNRDNCVQVEIVGAAAQSAGWSDGEYAFLAQLCRWVEKNHRVKRTAVNFKTQRRMAWPRWHVYSGWVGHRHVPGNDHTDPGAGFQQQKILGVVSRLDRWRAELRHRRNQLSGATGSGTRHFLVRRIGELKRAIVRERKP